ncbi:odorant receptor 13a-like isoform X2 [Vespula squamosa]|uniref:Odorant receptor 13a-like isoform X2 n=1 Tax=Vespula squamosa TaxID=30214 RepID=A0ABD2C256_VESSQ
MARIHALPNRVLRRTIYQSQSDEATNEDRSYDKCYDSRDEKSPLKSSGIQNLQSTMSIENFYIGFYHWMVLTRDIIWAIGTIYLLWILIYPHRRIRNLILFENSVSSLCEEELLIEFLSYCGSIDNFFVIKTITSTYHELLKTALNIDGTYLFYRDFLDRKFYIVIIYTSVRLLGVSKTIGEIVIDNIKLIITFGLNFKEIEQLFKKCRLNYSFRTDFSNTLRTCFVCHEFGFLKIRDSLFISLIIYGCLYNILALLDLTTYIKNFRYVIANITENMLVLMTVIKISVLRIKCSSLSRFLIETKADNTADNYKNDEERLIF